MKLSFFKPKVTISHKLRKDGFKPLHGPSEYWDELALAYIAQSYEPQLIRASIIHTEQEIAFKLRKKAQEILKERYTPENNRLYLLAKKWCSVPMSIEERAIKLGFTFLNMNEKTDEDSEIWELRINYYKPFDGEIDLREKIRWGGSNDSRIKDLKRLAKEMINKKYYEEDSELIWNTVVRWFTKVRP